MLSPEFSPTAARKVKGRFGAKNQLQVFPLLINCIEVKAELQLIDLSSMSVCILQL